MRPLIDDLRWRGLVHQVTDPEGLAELLGRGPVTAYIGFDPTADSLHVGHLQQICLLRRFQEAGHRPIALVGGGTGMIGDPSGRSDERNLLDAATLAANRDAIGAQLGRFVDFAGGSGRPGAVAGAGSPDAPSGGGALLVDNAEWLASVPLLEFLRDVGKSFSVNEMIRKDSVRARLDSREQGLSFTEFTYMLLQAGDFVQLYDRYGCRLQLGGSDQWGNITEGVDLVRRRRSVAAFGMTSPLVTKADGTKFGKTASGSVWLDARRTSPYEFFQFWLRSADAEVGPYLRRLTFFDAQRITELEAEAAAHPERREAQRALARELTTVVHGAGEAARAERAAEVLFTEEVASLDESTLAAALADAPTTVISRGELDSGLSVVDALVRTGLASSRGQGRQLITQGGVSINNRRASADGPLDPAGALHGRWVLLRRGPRSTAVLVVEG